MSSYTSEDSVGEPATSSSNESGHEDSINRGAGLDTGALQSNELAEILSVFDSLRAENIDAEIDIPQIVVCGDQSSGKSSVLEALAHVPFPVSSGTTTRFPTEIILRHSTVSGLDAQLIADAERPDEKKIRIEAFRKPDDVTEPEHFHRLIKAAGDHLQNLELDECFWRDLLQVTVSGPKRWHLTLIDLPGIIQSEDGANAMPGDRSRIKDLIRSYLEKPRTTVLAIVDAQNDVANQEIVSLVREVRGQSGRTLGIITKPDRLENGSDLQSSIVGLASNQGTSMPLGWHVLKNLPHERNHSFAERQQAELEFFSAEPWSQLDRGRVGINELRERLKDQLTRTVTEDLPNLTCDMQVKLDQCNAALIRLGPGRETIDQKKTYLFRVVEKLRRLIEAGIEGDYGKAEFVTFFHRADMALRDVINSESDDFARNMREQGHQYHVHTDGLAEGSKPSRTDLMNINHTLDFFSNRRLSTTGRSDEHKTANVSLQDYCDKLADYIDSTRGTNLVGNLAQGTLRAVFRQQSAFWRKLAREFVQRCYEDVTDFLLRATDHVAGQYTSAALHREYLDQEMESRHRILDGKVEELLWPFTDNHPMSYHPNFYLSASTLRSNDPVTGRKTLAEIAEANDAIFDGPMINAARVIDRSNMYYQVALNRFIDDLAILGIEKCLLHNLHSILTPEYINSTDEEWISRVASEPVEAQKERKTLSSKAVALEAAIGKFERYSRHVKEHASSSSYTMMATNPEYSD